MPEQRDIVLAVGLGALLALNLWAEIIVEIDTNPVTAMSYVWSIGAAAALAWRRVASIITMAVCAVSVAAYLITDNPPSPIAVTVLIALYTVAAERDRRTVSVVMGCLVLIVPVIAIGATQRDPSLLERVSVITFVIFPIVLGDAVRSRRRALAELAERLRITEESAELDATRRVQAERVRIARDLHDVVAHGIATINVQAGAAAHVMDSNPAAAADALLEIKRASKTALSELRATLHVLHDSDGLPDAPSPGIDDLSSLLADSPIDVSYEERGDKKHPIDSMVSLAAYRIVQEALTNVVKHAPGATVSVSLDHHADGIRISVDDDGKHSDAMAPPHDDLSRLGIGAGITGMGERARSVGGSVNAARRFGGGFSVVAELPYVPINIATAERRRDE